MVSRRRAAATPALAGAPGGDLADAYHAARLALRARAGAHAHAILDRTLALAAAPARGLLPDLLAGVATAPAPWRALCDGFAALGRDDPEIAALALPDDLVRRLVALADRARALDLDDLGRLFERALDEPAARARRGSARRREGAYYTPPALARRIAARALSPVLQDIFDRPDPAERRRALADLDVLDPACGAGVFLLAALDLLRDAHARLGGPRPSLLPRLHGVDLHPEAAERARICLWLAAAEPGTTLADLDRTIRAGDSILHDTWTDRSFAVVLGNPPYVRQEELTARKPHLARAYPEVFHGGADLCVYFFALGLRLVRPGGRLAFLASGSWLRAGYARGLRRLLRERTAVHALLDLGDSRVFADARDVYPVVLVAAPGPSPPAHEAEAVVLGRGDGLDALDTTFTIRVADQPDDGWQLVSPVDRRLLAHLQAAGPDLTERLGPLRCGLKTGLDDTFHLEPARQGQLLARDPALAPLLRPLLRGEDLRAWACAPPTRHLLLLPCGWTDRTFGTGLSEQQAWRALADRHPGLAAHLAPFAARAARRDDRGDFWWELRPCNYLGDLARPKLVWPELAGRPRFSLDRSGAALNNKGFFVVTGDDWLVPLLGSRPVWYLIGHRCLGLGERAGLIRYQLFARSLAHLPLPEPDADRRSALTALARELAAHAAARIDLHAAVHARLTAPSRGPPSPAPDLTGPPAPAPRRTTPPRDLSPSPPAGAARAPRAWTVADPRDLLARRRLEPRVRDAEIAWLAAQQAEHARLTEALARLEAAADAIAGELFDLDRAALATIAARTRYLYGTG